MPVQYNAADSGRLGRSSSTDDAIDMLSEDVCRASCLKASVFIDLIVRTWREQNERKPNIRQVKTTSAGVPANVESVHHCMRRPYDRYTAR